MQLSAQLFFKLLPCQVLWFISLIVQKLLIIHSLGSARQRTEDMHYKWVSRRLTSFSEIKTFYSSAKFSHKRPREVEQRNKIFAVEKSADYSDLFNQRNAPQKKRRKLQLEKHLMERCAREFTSIHLSRQVASKKHHCAARKWPNDKAKSSLCTSDSIFDGASSARAGEIRFQNLHSTRTAKSAPRVICCTHTCTYRVACVCVWVCITGGPSHKLLFSFFFAPGNIWHGNNFWDSQAAKHTSPFILTDRCAAKQRQVRKFWQPKKGDRVTHRSSVMSYLHYAGLWKEISCALSHLKVLCLLREHQKSLKCKL